MLTKKKRHQVLFFIRNR